MEEKEGLKIRLRKALEIRNKKPVDLSNNLKIPKSAISQYLSGATKKMDTERLYLIAEYLDVDEVWLMGKDVPMERQSEQPNKKKPITNDGLSDNMKALIDFAQSVPEDKAELVLRVMKSILEDD